MHNVPLSLQSNGLRGVRIYHAVVIPTEFNLKQIIQVLLEVFLLEKQNSNAKTVITFFKGHAVKIGSVGLKRQ